MAKKNKNIIKIFTESINLYFSNFDKFVKYMTFPVLGQLLGLVLIFTLTFFYAQNMPIIIQKNPSLNNFNLLFTIVILLILPGLLIFLKAFWEYLIAYGALNSMFENMVKSGKVYDFDAHTELIKRRSFSFVGLWFLVGIFSIMSIIPFFWVICAVFAVYFVLVFQVFTFEPELSPIQCVKQSFYIVKGNFLSTFILLALVGALTYVLVPQIAEFIFDYLNITNFLKNICIPLVNQLPINEWNLILEKFYIPNINKEQLALFIITTFIAQIFIQYTLPLRSIVWAMWYKNLKGKVADNYKSSAKKSSKKPSEKLMKESHKKFVSKKLDKNILRRAMEKDEE